jgi:hypothetical protein
MLYADDYTKHIVPVVIAPAGLASAVTVHTPVGAIHILVKSIQPPAWKHSVYS